MPVNSFVFDTWDTTIAVKQLFPTAGHSTTVQFRGERTHIAGTIHRTPAITVHHLQTSSGVDVLFGSTRPSDCYLILVALVGFVELQTRRHRQLRATPGEGLLVRFSALESLALSRNGDCLVTSISAEALHSKLARTASVTVKQIDFSPRFRTDSQVGTTLLALIKSFQEAVSGNTPFLKSPRTLPLLQRAIYSFLLEAFEHSYSDWFRRLSARQLPRPIKQAVEYIREHALSDITLNDVAGAAGTSPRGLQMAFHRHLTITPMSYVRQIRLLGARDELLHPAPNATVASVALKWQFPHLGSFAAHYSRAFGELPSESLRLSRTDLLPTIKEDDVALEPAP